MFISYKLFYFASAAILCFVSNSVFSGMTDVIDYCMDPGEGCIILPSTGILAAMELTVVDAFKLLPNKSIEVKPEKIGFWLYTKQNPESSDTFYLTYDAQNISKSYFDKEKNTKIFIHGWGQSGFSYNNVIPKAYLKKYDVNVVMVDWNAYSNLGYVKTRVYVVENVGKVVAQFIDNLVQYGQPLEKIHIIGHSLGGHISAFAAKNLKSGKAQRITALDPAGPLFHTSDIKDRLDSSDAKFVDVIHTDGLGLGFGPSLGHVDFYVNDGIAVQRGCELFSKRINCSHQQSVNFFAETITSDIGFYGRKCDSNILIGVKHELGLCSQTDIIPMAEDVPLNATGNYYVETAKEAPYALGRHLKEGIIERVQDVGKKLEDLAEKAKEKLIKVL